MSRRLQMLQVARLARRSLGESTDLVVSFLRGLAHPDGGYVNRDGRPDLYYTSFALDALEALEASPAGADAERTRRFLGRFDGGAELDFVHRCCLARAWAAQPRETRPAAVAESLLAGVARQRSADGGYASRAGADRGTAYGGFLAVNARADLGRPLESGTAEAAEVAASVRGLRSADGGWSNDPGQSEGSTTATAAAVATLCSLGTDVPTAAADWLLARRHPAGGFVATPDTPLPDLLSTAVALHALDAVDAPWRESRETMLDFIDSLWTAEGAFHGSWADDQPDAEYTFYGLVALGHASV